MTINPRTMRGCATTISDNTFASVPRLASSSPFVLVARARRTAFLCDYLGRTWSGGGFARAYRALRMWSMGPALSIVAGFIVDGSWSRADTSPIEIAPLPPRLRPPRFIKIERITRSVTGRAPRSFVSRLNTLILCKRIEDRGSWIVDRPPSSPGSFVQHTFSVCHANVEPKEKGAGIRELKRTVFFGLQVGFGRDEISG